ncbi:MAG: peroxidase [Bacteroidetes bacterium]|nr:peroxidase [Bacteroidota bacterium]
MSHHTNSVSQVSRSKLTQGFFGRMFRCLPPYDPPGATEQAKIASLQSIANTMLETGISGNFDNGSIPAGYTYFGQFIDHDITFDPVSSLMRQNDPDKLENFRTPKFDLDCIYGRGPSDQPYFYESDGATLLLGKNANNESDLMRNANGVAIIGDLRNDENRNVSQMQLMFISFHNKVVSVLKTQGKSGNALFEEAQRVVRWHYQWVVINDFVRRLCGQVLIDKLPNNPGGGLIIDKEVRLKFFGWEHDVYMPIEFSVAAYRLGHTMVRPNYLLSEKLGKVRTTAGKPAELPIFDVASNDDLRGFKPLPKQHTIQWDLFLDLTGNPKLQFSRKLDGKLSPGLGAIPFAGNSSLAYLNLLRSYRMDLPSGQDVARYMGIVPQHGNQHDPLWKYILEEAQTMTGGTSLGTVGAHIVAEVFVGLLACDKNSYLNLDPRWSPANETAVPIPFDNVAFQLRDIVKFSGVPVDDNDINNTVH